MDVSHFNAGHTVTISNEFINGLRNSKINNCSANIVGLSTSGSSDQLYNNYIGNSPILADALSVRQRPVVQPPNHPTISMDAFPNSDVIPYSTEELREKIFEKYFERNPSISPQHFRNEERAIQKAFFDFVLNVPILIDDYQIPRKSWAKAFYETDVINSAKCLFEALFSKHEMSSCTLNGKNGTQELSAVKMLAILRASCWMKNKDQDPYNFNADNPAHNVHPTKDEQDKIEKKVFTERRSQANRKANKSRRQSPNYNIDIDDSDSDTSRSVDAQDNESVRSDSSVIEHDENVEEDAFGELEELYYRHPDDFLERLLPEKTEIGIDGILIPRQIWEKAFQESQKDTIKASWTLFQFLFSSDEIMNCTLNGKNGTTELCPVRKLAIIRAVQWMSKNSNDLSKSSFFDNDCDECNLFPSEEDKERIETKVFTEKRYQQSRQLNTKNSKNHN